MKTNFYTIVFVLLVNLLYSQNIGDYKTIASGNWADYTKWQIYTASGWTASTQFPGQTSGNYSVSIEDGHTITVGTYGNGNNSPSSTSIYKIGDLIVKGQLTLNINLELNDTSYLLIDAGTVAWNQNNVYLKLKVNAEVSIINTGSGNCNNGSGINGYGLVGASCSNQNSLIIGNLTYSNCAGSGNAVAGDFCDVNQSGGTINATPTSSPSSLCYNSSQNNSVILTAPDNSNIILTKTYSWSVDRAPLGFIGITSTNTSSFVVNNLIPGTYVFRLNITSGSYSPEGTVTVTVYHTSPGTINSLNICSKYNTGNTLTLSGYFGTIVKWQSSTASDFSSNVTDIANTQNPLLLPDKLTTEMYYRAVLSNGNCSGFSAVASIKSLSTTYNGSGWSNGLPDTTKKAIFTNNYALQDNITACSAEISNNAIVTIPEGKNFTINNELEVNSGNLIVESDANLVQINNDAQNIGNITVKRKAKMKRLDYTYWSSPVSGQNLKNFSSSTLDTRFYVYNEGNDYFDGVFNYSSYPGFTVANAFPLQNKTTYKFETAKGYAIRAPNNYSTSEQTVDWTFTGVPNNGSQSIAVKKSINGYNLVGNPYPSSIRFSSLKTLNGSLLNYPVYFWNNSYTNPPQQQGSSYTQENYAILTASGGVKSTNGTQKPSDTISVGQGFIVAVNANANLVFNNSIRLAAKGQFFNMRKANSEVNRFWINFKTPANNNSEILIAYIEGATNEYDKDYDATLFTNTSDKIYSIQNDKELAIQGRSPNFTATDKVSLGVAFFEPGNYEISIAQVEGIFNGSQAIYLRDKNLNTTVNLSERAYQFFANAGETKNRFEIVYKPDSTLGTDNISKNQETLIYENNGSIFIENKANKIAEIQIFDAGGRLLNISKPNDHKFSIEKSKFDKGLLIFKINLKDKATTKKFLLK